MSCTGYKIDRPRHLPVFYRFYVHLFTAVGAAQYFALDCIDREYHLPQRRFPAVAALRAGEVLASTATPPTK